MVALSSFSIMLILLNLARLLLILWILAVTFYLMSGSYLSYKRVLYFIF